MANFYNVSEIIPNNTLESELKSVQSFIENEKERGGISNYWGYDKYFSFLEGLRLGKDKYMNLYEVLGINDPFNQAKFKATLGRLQGLLTSLSSTNKNLTINDFKGYFFYLMSQNGTTSKQDFLEYKADSFKPKYSLDQQVEDLKKEFPPSIRSETRADLGSNLGKFSNVVNLPPVKERNEDLNNKDTEDNLDSNSLEERMAAFYRRKADDNERMAEFGQSMAFYEQRIEYIKSNLDKSSNAVNLPPVKERNEDLNNKDTEDNLDSNSLEERMAAYDDKIAAIQGDSGNSSNPVNSYSVASYNNVLNNKDYFSEKKKPNLSSISAKIYNKIKNAIGNYFSKKD